MILDPFFIFFSLIIFNKSLKKQYWKLEFDPHRFCWHFKEFKRLLMLTIRKEQIDVFKDISTKNFEKTLVLHVQEVVPEIAKIAGEYNVRRIVQYGMQQALNYGFSYQGTVRFYIDLMLLLGYGFHDDPQFPWASKILNSSDSRGQMFRAKQLFVFLNDYLDTVYGKENIYLIEAINQFKDFNMVGSEHYHNNSHQKLLDKINFIYPQKFEYLGNQSLLEVIKKSKQVTFSLSFLNESSFIIIAILMFSFGHKVLEDPLYSWTYTSLNKVELKENKKIQILYYKIKTYLDYALINLKG